MKKIKMLMGGYGLTLKDGRVHLKTADDEPFDAPDKDAARLVDSGYAEYVGNKPAKKTPKPQKVSETTEEMPETEQNAQDGADEAEDSGGDFTESDYYSMTVNDLRKIADDLGVEYKAKDRKEDIIRKIEEAEPPSFEPQGVEP